MQIKGNGSKDRGAGAGARDIPLHPTLKRLGFLEFVHERRRRRPTERIFAEYRASQEHAGMVFSRAFVQWIKTTVRQLPDEKKRLFTADFHFPSLRALFTVEAIRSGMSERTFLQVHGNANEFRPDLDVEQEQYDLENACAEMERMDIESYFPPLYRYEELIAEGAFAPDSSSCDIT